MAFDWTSLIGPVVGGALGYASGGDKQTTTTQNRDPWAPAQPYILDNLKTNAALQQYYQKNPFNQQQIEGYSNLFGDNQNFHDNVMPGLLDFANKGMTSNYQRATGGALGSRAGYGGDVKAGGLLSTGQTGPFSSRQSAMPGAALSEGPQLPGVAQPNSANRNQWLDLNGAQNPFNNGVTSAQAATAAAAQAQPAAQSQVNSGLLSNDSIGNGNGGNVGAGNQSVDSGNVYGIGSSFSSEAAASVASKASALGLGPAAIAGLVAGIVNGYMSEAEVAAAVASLDQALEAQDAARHGYGGLSNGGYGGSMGSAGNNDGSRGGQNADN